MISLVARAALTPLRDGAEVLDGLSDCELRERAAIRLGADLVAGMSLANVCDYLLEEPNHDG